MFLFENFKNEIFSIPHDNHLNIIFQHHLNTIENNIHEIENKRNADPEYEVYTKCIPIPQYISKLDEPQDRISIDEYINNPPSSESFNAIGRICNLTKTSLNNIRNQETQTRKNFFDKTSLTLTEEFRKFWSQTEYDLLLTLEEGNLVFTVRDKISEKVTAVSQRSEGLKWILALFFKMRLLASSAGSSHILLLDSPATAIHDAGKEEVRRFMTHMAENHNMQIIYTTHEKALVDPWRLDRIRFVKKTREKGTVIHEVKDNGIDSTRIEISKHVGSPAKYSLFGAPITVLLEGSSDYRFVAALNEHAIRTGKRHLHPDVYAINDMGGIDNSKNMSKILDGLGLAYLCVVDGGKKSRKIRSDIGEKKFSKHFIQITDIVNSKEAADIEDFIDPHLYHYLIEKTYPDLQIPAFDVKNTQSKKTVTYYAGILKDKGERLDKVGIATALMDAVKDPPQEIREPLCRTIETY